MKRTFGILMVAAVFTLVASSAFAQRTGPANIQFSGKTQNKINFMHQAHEARVPDCKTCHHMGVGTGTCRDCHGQDSRFPDLQTALHTKCRGCHEEKGISAATNCAYCHVSTTTSTSGSSTGTTDGSTLRKKQ